MGKEKRGSDPKRIFGGEEEEEEEAPITGDFPLGEGEKGKSNFFQHQMIPSDRPPTRSQQQGKGWDTRRSEAGESPFFLCCEEIRERSQPCIRSYATPIARFPRLSHSLTCRPPFRVGLPPWLSVLPLGCCVLYGRLGAVKPPSAATARTELCESGSVSTLVTTGLTPPAVPEERGGYSVRSRGVELPTVGAFARSP